MGTEFSKSTVSELCKRLDPVVTVWNNRPLSHTPFPFVLGDALYLKIREDGRVINRGVMVGMGVNEDGRRELLGMMVGDTETNSVERLNEEVRRRERVIRIFPNRESVIRLIGALMMELDEKWATERKFLDMAEYFEWRKTRKASAKVTRIV